MESRNFDFDEDCTTAGTCFCVTLGNGLFTWSLEIFVLSSILLECCEVASLRFLMSSLLFNSSFFTSSGVSKLDFSHVCSAVSLYSVEVLLASKSSLLLCLQTE